eukprot:scaffold19489_cov110-Isochrysis_galbana.AAC.4
MCEHGETVHSNTVCLSMAPHSLGLLMAGGGVRTGGGGGGGGTGGRASQRRWRVASSAAATVAWMHAVVRRVHA